MVKDSNYTNTWKLNSKTILNSDLVYSLKDKSVKEWINYFLYQIDMEEKWL